mmetsp:Transcript_592/g.652  ORF Transcript_592/g.652 Transcript_592/m.652 type:complete len:107 (+) Transcript_592:1472-1792(+)
MTGFIWVFRAYVQFVPYRSNLFLDDKKNHKRHIIILTMGIKKKKFQPKSTNDRAKEPHGSGDNSAIILRKMRLILSFCGGVTNLVVRQRVVIDNTNNERSYFARLV